MPTRPSKRCRCGAAIPAGVERCRSCEARRNATRVHYLGDYRSRSAEVRRSATRCHLCGEGPHLDDPWRSDHLVAGDPASPLLPAHRSCNARRRNLTVDEYRARFGVTR